MIQQTLFISLFLAASFANAAGLESKLIRITPNSDSAKILLTVAQFVGDQESRDIAENRAQRIEGREQEANDIIDTLVRMKSRVPVLVAPPGVGKTAIVQRAIQKVIQGDYPQTQAFNESLRNAHWIQMTPGRLLKIAKSNNEIGRMKAIEDFFEAVINLEKKLEIQIVVFIDEIHNLDSAQMEAILPFLESQNMSVRVVGATNGNKFTLAFKDNEALMRRIRQIAVAEFDDETTLRLVEASWIPKIEATYGVQFADDAKKRLVKFGTILAPDGGKFDAAIKLAQDLAIWNQRDSQKSVLSQEELFKFFKEKTRFPVDPFNKSELHQYLRNLEAEIANKLVGQHRMIRDVVEVFRDVVLGTKKDMGVIGLVGPSGTGKSELGKLIASLGFNNPRSFLKIDANEYQNDDMAQKKLFGAEGGLVTSDKRVGILPEYFDDPSQGKYGGVILIDEAEKAHPKFWQRLMEFFEEGSFRGGDGKIRKAKRHLVILTSNRGDSILFPESMRNLEKKRITEHAMSIGEPELKRLFQIKTSGGDEFQIPTPVLNRIDRWTVSTPLHAEDVNQIAENFSLRQIADIEDQFQLKLTVDLRILHRVAGISFDPQYGARPVERALTRFFNDLKDKILASDIDLRGVHLDISEKKISNDQATAVIQARGRELFELSLPRLVLDEPLLGTALHENLQRIDAIMPNSIIGQDDAVARVRDVLVTYLSTPVKRRQTLGILLVGLTGVGKTEMAKATAEALFGGSERAEVLPMGEIQSEAEFNLLVGSPPGYVGSDQIRAFERALLNHPEGGVIVLDEVTNIGGGDKGRKEALFKRLYNFFEEGKWTSAATGTTYDLKKYVFILTGNDGEKLFQGTTSEIMRLQTWESSNKPVVLHKMLVERGIPEPFLGRMADTILMKPLLRKETAKIAEKLLEPVLSRFRELGYRIDAPPDFAEQFGQMFFTQQKGARSLRSLAQTKLNAMVAEVLVMSRERLSDQIDKWVKIEIESNLDGRPFVEDPSYAPKVEVLVTVGHGKTDVATVRRNVTQFAALDKKLSKKQALATAYHEAGHAVLNDPKVTGMDLRYLTILGSEGNLGFAMYDDGDQPHRYRPTDNEKMRVSLARVLGGQVAMVMAGHQPDAGWGSDLEKARSLVRRYVVDWALNKEFLGLVTDEQGRPLFSDNQLNKVSSSMERLMIEGVELAMQSLLKRWDLVEAVVEKLMADGFINQAEYQQMVKEFEGQFDGQPKRTPPVADCIKLLLGDLKPGA